MIAGAAPPFHLDGRVIIVTGAGAGIGLATAEAASAMGARLVIAEFDRDAGEAAAEALRRTGAEALAVQTDVSDAASTEAMARQAMEAFGAIDGLVNNAGLMSALPRRAWHNIPLSEWDRVIAVNLRGLFLCCRAAWRALAQAQGAIVNLVSSRVFEGTPNRLHYTASKAGLVGMIRALARELGQSNVRVNAIVPGLTLSPRQIETSDPDYLVEISRGRALPGVQTPADLIGAILFLLSPASGVITGQTLVVDGGKAMH